MVFRHSMAGNLKELNCDILICGAGLAGLSLVYRAIKAAKWLDQKIVIVDQEAKGRNDKTWSFWTKDPGPFDELIFRSWSELAVFANNGQKINLDSGSYTYKSIRSIDFYQYTLAFLEAQHNVSFIFEPLSSLVSSQEGCLAITSHHRIHAAFAFNSIYKQPALKTGAQYFLQHFKGVVVKSSEICMKADEAYLMDFRTSQTHGATFFYTLPLSADELFVEYTLFSKYVLDQSSYDDAIAAYIKNILKLSSYEVLHTEFGVIPMTDHQFSRFEGRIVNIGTIGGDTRGATGYTFTNIQKTVTKILSAWSGKNPLSPWNEVVNAKHRLFDAILLNVLNSGAYAGHRLFCDLFKNVKAHYIFKFLDAETRIPDDLRIITSLKPMPFVHALRKVIRAKTNK